MIKIPISIGQFFDQYSILLIKSERIKDLNKLKNIYYEFSILFEHTSFSKSDMEQIERLKKVNEKLWDIEDAIRLKEQKKEFDDEFIELARSVYKTNDERSRIKAEINKKFGSAITEEKEHPDYE